MFWRKKRSEKDREALHEALAAHRRETEASEAELDAIEPFAIKRGIDKFREDMAWLISRGDPKAVGMHIGSGMEFLSSKKGTEAAVDFAMQCFEGKSGDEIQKLSMYIREDMLELLGPRLFKDPRF